MHPQAAYHPNEFPAPAKLKKGSRVEAERMIFQMMNDLQRVSIEQSSEKPDDLVALDPNAAHNHTQDSVTLWRFRIVLIAFLIITAVTITIVINEYIK